MTTTPAKSITHRILRAPPVEPPKRLLDEPRYRALRSEIDRAQEVSAEATDWAQVEALGLALLGEGYDDLLVAAYTARGAQERDLLHGIELGLALFTELLGPRWDTATPPPRRLRARTSALRWWVRAATEGLSTAEGRPRAAPKERFDRLDASLQHLDLLTRERADDDAPSLAALRRELRRRRTSTPDPDGAPTPGPRHDTHNPPSAPTPRDAEPGALSAESATPETSGEPRRRTASGGADDTSRALPPAETTSTPSPESTPRAQLAGSDPGTPRDLERLVRRLGESLVETGERLRSIDPRDPRSYDLLRHGLWLHLQALPPTVEGKTTVAETSPSAMRQIEALRARARWGEVIDLAERLVIRHRLDLNLQRTTAEALLHLTPPAEAAAARVRTRTLEYIDRFPGALDLRSCDGAPLADAKTRGWLRSPPPPQPAAGAGAPSGKPPTASTSPALRPQSTPQGHVARSSGGSAGGDESRFLHGLELAEGALRDGHRPLASALFAGLVETVEHHRLDRWRPDLAQRARAGAISSQTTPLDPTSPELRRLSAAAPDVVAELFANAR